MPETVASASETRERTEVRVEVRDLSDDEEQERIEQRDRLNPGGSE